jgi:hypothetical protein
VDKDVFVGVGSVDKAVTIHNVEPFHSAGHTALHNLLALHRVLIVTASVICVLIAGIVAGGLLLLLSLFFGILGLCVRHGSFAFGGLRQPMFGSERGCC